MERFSQQKQQQQQQNEQEKSTSSSSANTSTTKASSSSSHNAPTIVTTHSSASSLSGGGGGGGGGSVVAVPGSSTGSTSSLQTQGTIEKISRPMAFDKMESLVREMQEGDNSVPVKSQKMFLTTIPQVFMGYDLVDWLMERLNIEECEALNLSYQLCLYGYLFPATECKHLFVKDDSTFYRFQSPYYWPMQHKPPDNVEYAIYLVKRVLRNKPKHALEDNEIEALNNLQKNLKGKWEFINMQAEEQLRLVKENKRRTDKQVTDSQEKAYWRVHRPPPGQFSPLEPCPVPSRCKPRKRTLEDVTREVEMLKNSITRTRMKMSQACESLVQYYETYAEHDPLMTSVQPSNPWVTDDTTLWQFNAPLVEVYSEKRVKKWAISIEDCVNDPTGLAEFTAYLKKEYSHENIRFWTSVNDLRRSSQSQIARKVKEIYEEFLKPGAPCEINIDGKTMEQVQHGLKSPSRFAFDIAAEHIYALLLKKDCYPRFIRSEHYKTLVANAVQPSAKKRFFGFGGAAKKKGSTSQAPNTSLLGQGASQSTGMNVVTSLTRRRGSDRSLTGSAHELAVSGVKDTSKVPHSHSQSNLSEITYGTKKSFDKSESKFSTNLEVSIEVPTTSCSVCPWDDPEEPEVALPPPKPPPPVITREESIDVSDVSDKMKKSCKLRQQNTLDSDFHSSKRLLPATNEHRRASMTNATEFNQTQIHARTSSFSESVKPVTETKPLQHETSISTPLLVIEAKSIQASTIPEESSRANSEANLNETLKLEPTPPPPLPQPPQLVDTDKSSSQSSLPIINVSTDETSNEPCDEDEEKPAEASIPEEQTLSRENIPGVIKKLSIQSEEQLLQELRHQEGPKGGDSLDEEETQSDFSGGYVPPAPTPAPSMAPLAEIEADPEAEEDQEVPQHIEAEVAVCGEHGDTHHHKKRKKKKDKEQSVKGDPVCPWEDEDDNTVETPFVKTYSTLGYL